MKPMSDRKMDMNKGKPDSEPYFPEDAHYKDLAKASDIKGFKYPDSEQDIHRDQEEFVKDASKNQPKPGFRH